MVPLTASRRLTCPSTLFCQVGELESSKSAMKTLAPEFSALMIILRSTGPVISTRRSSRSVRNGRDRPLALADARGLREEVGHAAVVDFLLPDPSSSQEFPAAAFELSRQPGEEGAGFRGENLRFSFRVGECCCAHTVSIVRLGKLIPQGRSQRTTRPLRTSALAKLGPGVSTWPSGFTSGGVPEPRG